MAKIFLILNTDFFHDQYENKSSQNNTQTTK